jgi:hypothetical protein
MNYRTPAPIRHYLSAQHTNAVASHAVIEQAHFTDLGWCNVTHLPFPTRSSICVLRDRGATRIAVSYCKPHTGTRVLADFTVSECLAAAS